MSKTVKFKNSKSIDGAYTVSLTKKLTERLNNYCRTFNVNRKDFVNKAVENALKGIYEKELNRLTKDEVISLYLNSVGEQEKLEDYEQKGD